MDELGDSYPKMKSLAAAQAGLLSIFTVDGDPPTKFQPRSELRTICIMSN